MIEIIKSELAFTNGLVIMCLFFVALLAFYVGRIRKDKIAIKNSLGRLEHEYRNIYEILAEDSLDRGILNNTNVQLEEAIEELQKDDTDNQLVHDYVQESLINTRKLLGIHKEVKLPF